MDEVEKRARWEGEMQARVSALERGQEQMRADVGKLVAAFDLLRIEFASIKSKVGVWAAIGSIIGAGVVSAIATGAFRL